jgi:hypothetical protein
VNFPTFRRNNTPPSFRVYDDVRGLVVAQAVSLRPLMEGTRVGYVVVNVVLDRVCAEHRHCRTITAPNSFLFHRRYIISVVDSFVKQRLKRESYSPGVYRWRQNVVINTSWNRLVSQSTDPQFTKIKYRLQTCKAQWLTMFTARFNVPIFYVLPTHCIYVFWVDLKTNCYCIVTSSCKPSRCFYC